jgi:hypothetical protein
MTYDATANAKMSGLLDTRYDDLVHIVLVALLLLDRGKIAEAQQVLIDALPMPRPAADVLQTGGAK